MKYILFFSECGEQDIDQIGRKGTNLALLFKRGFKVPPGFILSGYIFDIVKQDKKLKRVISELFSGKQEAKLELQELLKKFEFPEEIEDEIVEAYLSLSVDLNMNASSLLETKEVFVAVRSSAIDKKNLFPKLVHKTVLNVKGKKRIIKAVLEDYYNMIVQVASQHKDSADIDDLSLAIIIQKMVSSKKSGTACSINEETNEKQEIIVKACFGLGEGISSGSVFPDTYKVDKKTLTITDTDIAEKQYEFVKDIDSDETIKHRLGEKSLKQVLDDNEVVEISRILKKISIAFEKEIKIEWAIKDNIIYVLQMKDVKHAHKETVEMEILPDKDEEQVPDVIDIAETDLDDDLQMLDEIEKYEQKQSIDEKVVPEQKDVVKIEDLNNKESDMPEYNIVQPEIFDLSGEKVNNEEDNIEEKDEEENMIKDMETYDDEPEEQEEIEEISLDDDELDETEDAIEEEIDEEIEETIEEEIADEPEEEPEEKGAKDIIKEESIFDNFDSFKVEEETITQPPMNSFTELAKLNAANTIVFCHMAIKDKLRQRLSKHVVEVPEDFDKILTELREYESVENDQELRKLNKVRNDYIHNKKYPEADDVALGLKLLEK